MTKINMKITRLKCHYYLPGTNELLIAKMTEAKGRMDGNTLPGLDSVGMVLQCLPFTMGIWEW